jgi:hypothetical protein
MVKFAKGEEKPFDPISNKLLSAIATPPQDEAPSPAPSESAAADRAPAASSAEAEKSAEPKREPAKKPPGRAKKPASKRPELRVLTKNPPRGEQLTRAVKCLFTPSEEQELRAMVARLAYESGTKLTLSHLMRPYFDLLLHCEEHLSQELRRAGLSRPLNDKTALALFERQLAEVIHGALRKAPLLRSDRVDPEE